MQELERLSGKKWYFTNSHNLCSDQEGKMDGWLHLWGLEWICPCLQKRGKFYNLKIVNLFESNIPYEYVCQACKILNAYEQEECPYHQQNKKLKDATKVMSPIQYSITGMFRDFQADHVVVDDCETQKRDHLKREKLEKYFALAYDLIYKIMPKISFEEFLRDPEFDKFVSSLKEIREQFMKGEMLAVTMNCSTEKSIFSIYADEFETYQKYCQKYGYKERFSTPFFFYLFDYITENPKANLTILDAKPNKMFMTDLKLRYEFENSKAINFEWETIQSNFKDLGSTIHQCLSQKDAWFPLITSIDNDKTEKSHKRRVWIGDAISKILENFNNPVIGFVSSRKQYKNATKKVDEYSKIILESECEFIKPEWNVRADHVLWFWNQRGMNSLEKCDVIFIVGTPVINQPGLVDGFALWFPNIELTTTDIVEKEPHGTYYHYKDAKLENFRTMFEEDELYHAILRGRPHIYKRDIYCFCLVPEEIKNDPILHFDNSFKRNRGDKMIDKRKEWLLKFLTKERKNQDDVVKAMTKAEELGGLSERRAYEEVLRLRRECEKEILSERSLGDNSGKIWLSLR